MQKPGSQDSSILQLFNSLMDRVSDASANIDMKAEQDVSLLDASLSIAKQFFERQAAGGLSLIRLNDTVDDFIAIKGEAVELALDVDFLQALANIKVNFFVDEKLVGSSAVGPERKGRTTFIPKKTGCFATYCTIRNSSGVEVRDNRTQSGVLLHVLDKNPVICVDADLMMASKEKLAKKLKRIYEKGFEFVYVDFSDKDRIDELREVRQHSAFPEGAIISLTGRIRQFESFDVDFKQTFLGLTVSRLRAAGAPVVALLTNLKPDYDHAFPRIKVYRENSAFSDNTLSSLKTNARSFLAKRKKHKSENLSDIDWRINEMVQADWISENDCHVELNNKLAREEIFAAIESAKKQVDLQFYIFKECRFTHELGVCLSRAASRGVRVRLMVDALWSGEDFLGSWNSFLKRMGKSKQIHIIAADSVSMVDEWGISSLRQRDHRKLVIVDGNHAFVGGRNAADEYYYDWSEVPIADWTLADRIPWLDAHASLKGKIVSKVQKLFDRTWERNGGKKFSSFRVPASDSCNSGGNKQSRSKLIVHEGTHDANGLAAYEALICGAKRKLILVNDFPVLDDVAEMLIQAVRRGVNVNFITGSVLARRVDGSFFEGGKHRELFEYVVKSRLGTLVDSGVKVYEFQTPVLKNIAVEEGRVRPYVHAKLITADSRYASIGSANLDITASYWEREANVFFDDEKLVRSLDRKLAAIMKQGIKLETSSLEWKREAPQREIVAKLWPDSYLT